MDYAGVHGMFLVPVALCGNHYKKKPSYLTMCCFCIDHFTVLESISITIKEERIHQIVCKPLSHLKLLPYSENLQDTDKE